MELHPTQERLRALIAAQAHATLREYLETRTRVFRRPAEIVFAAPPASDSPSWRPGAPFVVIVEPLAIAGNVVTGVEGIDASRLILLGGLRAANVLNSPDTEVYIGGPCVVPGLLYAAMPDATFVTAGPLEAGVVYAGHGDGCVTALGPTTIDVLDDYVEGPDDDTEIVARRDGVQARDVVVPALLDATGELAREDVLARFLDTLDLVRR